MTNEQSQQQELGLLSAFVHGASRAQIQGTFSERNPLLGKMVRCVFCRTRRRANDKNVCCHPRYAVTKKVRTAEGITRVECLPRFVEGLPRSLFAHKRKNPRLSRNKPPLFLVHQLLVEMERTPGFVEKPGLSATVERQIARRRRQERNTRIRQQKLSRRINRSQKG